MLTLFLIAGFGAALAAPLFLSSDGDDAAPELAPEDVDDEALISLLEDGAEGATYEATVGDEAVTLWDFDPERDTLDLLVDSFEADFAEIALDGGGVGLVYSSGEDLFEIHFPHLDVLPVDSIEVVFGTDEEDETTIPLSALVEDETGEILSPAEGAIADIPTGADAGPALHPVDGDLADVPTGEAALGDPLQPVIDEGAEIIALYPAARASDFDEVEDGEDGENDIFLVHPAAGGAPDRIADIIDFVPGEDVLRITYFTAAAPESISIEVGSEDEDGADGVIRIGGQVVAVLRLAPDVTKADVEVDIRPTLRAAVS